MDINDMERHSRDYTRIEKAIDYIDAHRGQQPSLAQIAGAAGLSEFHFQKLFSRWVGISPKRFLQFLTKEHAKQLLERSQNILDVAYETGLSGPGRLHDLFISCEAMTPGAYKEKGKGLFIGFGFSPSPFGNCMIAFTGQGICALKFVRDSTEQDLSFWLDKTWPRAAITRDDNQARSLAGRIFPATAPQTPAPLHLFIKGTNFQIKVWEALTRIPFGHTVTYQDIAEHIGHPGAVRAVGTAVGKNPVPFLIPCHRVIRKMGVFGNYGEGKSRKKAILGWESARTGAKIA
ncbi:MAG: methylated-DNA--[protein]-cysteine S-methyltransferase [Desulfobacter sp.]